jgi:ubiquinone/menaquinone biosynthesis C-methylase UbiE
VPERIMIDIALGFRNADGEILSELVHCLDFMNGLPFFKAYKAHTWERLKIRSGQKLLDVACGIGFDVIEMAKRFPSADLLGVDSSEGFLEIAKSRAGNLTNVKFLQGNGDRLPLPLHDNEFDGVRIDRSLQHMKDTRSAIKEMVRVTRPEGHIVAASQIGRHSYSIMAISILVQNWPSCPASAPLRQFWRVEEWRISGSS